MAQHLATLATLRTNLSGSLPNTECCTSGKVFLLLF